MSKGIPGFLERILDRMEGGGIGKDDIRALATLLWNILEAVSHTNGKLDQLIDLNTAMAKDLDTMANTEPPPPPPEVVGIAVTEGTPTDR
jgi:hypothetical protein